MGPPKIDMETSLDNVGLGSLRKSFPQPVSKEEDALLTRALGSHSPALCAAPSPQPGREKVCCAPVCQPVLPCPFTPQSRA